MSKRLSDTDKYKKPFLRSLKGAYKLLWDYLYHDCNHAGIWIVDFDIAQIYIGADMPINKKDALKYFNNDKVRIIELDGGKKWFIITFVEFQYGELNPKNRVHYSVLQKLKKYSTHKKIKHLISPLQEAKDKDKDKNNINISNINNEETKFNDLSKKHKYDYSKNFYKQENHLIHEYLLKPEHEFEQIFYLKPITKKQCDKILSSYDPAHIKEVLKSMENWTELLNVSKTMNLTLQKRLKKYPTKAPNEVD